MMPLEAGLVDTNVLIYAVDADAPQHSASRALLDAAQNGSVRLYVTSQVLCEFYSVITNPRRVTAARSPSEALEALDALINFPGMSILPTPVRAVNGWMELLRRYPVKGGDVFDLQLVATMQAADIHTIYTFNTDDFAAFDGVAVHTPQ